MSSIMQLEKRPVVCTVPATFTPRQTVERPLRAHRGPQLQTARAAASATAPTINLATQPLSTYSMPLRQPRLITWLEECIRDAVRNLEQAPFVQLYLPGQRSIHRHRVTEDFVQAPQIWAAIAQHLAQATPDVLLLIHPIHLVRDSAQQAVSNQLKRRKSASGDVMTGMTAQPKRRRARKLRPQDLKSLIDSGVAQEQFSGRVGECCEDEVYAQVLPIGAPGRAHGALGSKQGSYLDGSVQYHGVVVQSAQDESDIQGCYVLKTVQSQSQDCQCSHYTLTRVSRGQPLAEQLAASWLC